MKKGFRIGKQVYQFNDLRDIKLNQFIALSNLKMDDEIAYIVEYAHIMTGVDKATLLNANLEDLTTMLNHINGIIDPNKIKENLIDQNSIELDGERLSLPSWNKESKSLFTDMTLQRYALMETLTFAINDLNEGKTESIAALLACLYIRSDETFTDELFLQRKAKFLNADMNTVYNAFFLQTKRLSRFTTYMNFYLKALGLFVSAQRMSRRLWTKLGLTTAGQA